MHLTKDQMFHGRSKHINIKYHFVWCVISQCNILLNKIDTEDNLADMLIKSLPIAKFNITWTYFYLQHLKPIELFGGSGAKSLFVTVWAMVEICGVAQIKWFLGSQ